MSEKIPNNVESFSDWRALEANAENDVKEALDAVADFESKSNAEKKIILAQLLESFNTKSEDRFKRDEAARLLSIVREEDRHEKRMGELQRAA